jgi:SHS2 domain-containing protein
MNEKRPQKKFQFEDHTADVQVKAWGETLEEAFAQTALSLMTTISPDLEAISQKKEKSLAIEAEDLKALLFDFLSELLYIFDVEKLIFSHINIESIEELENKYQLVVMMKGEKFDKEKHEIGTEVKAITYSYMNIEKKGGTFQINIVFDI